jgi:hypothetical protein
MTVPVVGEKSFLLRIPPDLYEKVRQVAARQERSANWIMIRLLRRALEQSPDWIDDATR